MASPIGHTLIAVLAARMPTARATSWTWLFLAGVATIAPDLDFLAGLVVGEINRYHHGISHSLGAAVMFGVLAALAGGRLHVPRVRLGVIAASLYASHLVLDFLTVDTRPPFGQPLFWPLSSRYVALGSPFLMGIRHNADDGLGAFVIDVLSLHNLNAAFREVLVVAPVVLLFWWIGTRVAGNASSSLSAPRSNTRTVPVLPESRD
jgi:inner membrane protein